MLGRAEGTFIGWLPSPVVHFRCAAVCQARGATVLNNVLIERSSRETMG